MIYLLRFAIITLLGAAASVAIATWTIRNGLRWLQKPESAQEPERRNLGFWIGCFETILIFVFVFHDEFSALAIIFAAKEFVRKEKILADPGYYLLGTLANLSTAVLLALITKWVAASLCG
jgi:hypothetical protein